ncbi:MAG: hypothetical protein R6U58_02095 [Bacteroidales bacterium]
MDNTAVLARPLLSTGLWSANTLSPGSLTTFSSPASDFFQSSEDLTAFSSPASDFFLSSEDLTAALLK